MHHYIWWYGLMTYYFKLILRVPKVMPLLLTPTENVILCVVLYLRLFHCAMAESRTLLMWRLSSRHHLKRCIQFLVPIRLERYHRNLRMWGESNSLMYQIFRRTSFDAYTLLRSIHLTDYHIRLLCRRQPLLRPLLLTYR